MLFKVRSICPLNLLVSYKYVKDSYNLLNEIRQYFSIKDDLYSYVCAMQQNKRVSTVNIRKRIFNVVWEKGNLMKG